MSTWREILQELDRIKWDRPHWLDDEAVVEFTKPAKRGLEEVVRLEIEPPRVQTSFTGTRLTSKGSLT